MMKKSTPLAVALLLLGSGAGTMGTALAQEHRNPVDQVSNPEALNYTDVVIGMRDLTEPFQRDGPIREPRFFTTIRPGMAQAEIQSVLGQPLWQARSDKREWNYNVKFRMPDSENYLVCQYKVVFDNKKLVKETVWRRRQCQQLVNAN